MRNRYVSFLKKAKMEVSDSSNSNTRMCWNPGEGGSEIVNQGWTRVLCFSQETGASGLNESRIDSGSRLKNLVQDARKDILTHLPFFSTRAL